MSTRKTKTKPQKKVEKIDTIEKLAGVMAGGFSRVDTQFAEFDKRMTDGFAEVYQRVANGFSEVHEQFDDVYRRFDQIDIRFDAVDLELRSIRAEIKDIHARLERLEEQGAMQSGYAKEIDYLLERVARIEKHLSLL